jgi:hypothetical protein
MKTTLAMKHLGLLVLFTSTVALAAPTCEELFLPGDFQFNQFVRKSLNGLPENEIQKLQNELQDPSEDVATAALNKAKLDASNKPSPRYYKDLISAIDHRDYVRVRIILNMPGDPFEVRQKGSTDPMLLALQLNDIGIVEMLWEHPKMTYAKREYYLSHFYRSHSRNSYWQDPIHEFFLKHMGHEHPLVVHEKAEGFLNNFNSEELLRVIQDNPWYDFNNAEFQIYTDFFGVHDVPLKMNLIQVVIKKFDEYNSYGARKDALLKILRLKNIKVEINDSLLEPFKLAAEKHNKMMLELLVESSPLKRSEKIKFIYKQKWLELGTKARLIYKAATSKVEK